MRRKNAVLLLIILVLATLISIANAELLLRRARTKSSSSSDPLTPTSRRVTTAQKRPRQDSSSSGGGGGGAILASVDDRTIVNQGREEVEPTHRRSTRLRPSVSSSTLASDWQELDDLLFAPDEPDLSTQSANLDDEEGRLSSIAAVMNSERAKTNRRKEKVDTNEVRSQMCDDYVEEAVDPFYLDNVPDTLAGQTYKKYETRYWFMKQNNMHMRKKFFAPSRTELVDKNDRAEFHRYAERFKMRLPHRIHSHTKRNRQYKLKRFGPKDKAAKTAEQMRETRHKSLRDYLSCRLKRILGMKCAKKTGGTRWTKENEQMMRELNMMTPLDEEDPVVKLYNKMMNSKGMGSFLPSPPSSPPPASSPDLSFIAAEPSQDSSEKSHNSFGDPAHISASDTDDDR